jgi:LPXTG-motif cell wall-anchored protein
MKKSFHLKGRGWVAKALLLLVTLSWVLNAGHNGVALASTDSLLAEASILLKYSALPTDWSDGDDWINSGMAGSALNAKSSATSSNAYNPKTPVEYVAASSSAPAGLKTEFPPDGVAYYGLYIPNSPYFDIPDTGGVTIMADITPLNPSQTSKIAYNYPLSDLPLSGRGWVMENVVGVPNGNLITASNYIPQASSGLEHPEGFAAALYPKLLPERQTVAFRFDRDAKSWHIFKNGTNVISVSGVGGVPEGFGSVLSEGDLLFGPGYIMHNFVVINRAISDPEMSRLNSLLNDETCTLSSSYSTSCDVDNDGASDYDESRGSNNGDINDDGIPDKDQPHVVSYGYSGKRLSMIAPIDLKITDLQTNELPSQVVSNADYDFPFGSTKFSARVVPGSSKSFSIYFLTDLATDKVFPKKVNNNSGAISQLSNATVNETIIGTDRYIKVDYMVTDGGLNDEDNEINGIIIDPVVLAVTKNVSTKDNNLANTGQNGKPLVTIASLAIVGGIGSLFVIRRQTKAKR